MSLEDSAVVYVEVYDVGCGDSSRGCPIYSCLRIRGPTEPDPNRHKFGIKSGSWEWENRKMHREALGKILKENTR